MVILGLGRRWALDTWRQSLAAAKRERLACWAATGCSGRRLSGLYWHHVAMARACHRMVVRSAAAGRRQAAR